MTSSKWTRQADVVPRKREVPSAGVRPGTSTSDNAGLREARRRSELLERENEVLRRAAAYLSQADLPGGSGRGTSRS